MSADERRLSLGFLVLGAPEHGLARYARLLAQQARLRGDLAVLEVWVGPGSTGDEGDALAAAARQLSGCDVVHVQVNRAIWGGGLRQLTRALRFCRALRAPLVVTLHDVYPEDPWRPFRRRQQGLGARFRAARRALRDRWPGNAALMFWSRRAAALIVCSEVEAERAKRWCGNKPPVVIDHFVEPREALPDRVAARAALGLTSEQLVVLLGFVHPAKGGDILLESLPLLPERVHVWLAGRPSPGDERFAKRLAARAESLGVAKRFRITGWLEARDQSTVLAAADLAVAPYRFASASGSLATWISAGRSVLCSDLPQIARFDALAPGSLPRFSPLEPTALATAIRRELDVEVRVPDPRVARLRDVLALPHVFEAHLEVYRRALRAASAFR